MVTIKLSCGGCDATAEFTIRKRFHGITGRSHGFGTWKWDSIDANTPEGWTAADPWTAMAYCPRCFEEICEPVELQGSKA